MSKYIFIRDYESIPVSDFIMKKSKVHPEYTIVSQVFKNQKYKVGIIYGELSNTDKLHIGWSVCGGGDKFNKDIGIELAKKRFLKGKVLMDITTCPNCYKADVVHGYYEVAYQLLQELYGKNEDPTEVLELARTLPSPALISSNDSDDELNLLMYKVQGKFLCRVSDMIQELSND